ncbi:MAG TPA: transcriptional repressor [Bacteroidales bacterium]|nr:transcriptional repressor [Bacteroidales bacterium]
MRSSQLREKLSASGLKITPQRMAVLEAVHRLKDHPSTEKIIAHVQKAHPNIAVGTIYKILETFTDKGLLSKVKTEQERMRYDVVTQRHHHLYCAETDRIEDYMDEELSAMLEEYFRHKAIPGFEVKDLRVEIKGHFLKEQPH